MTEVLRTLDYGERGVVKVVADAAALAREAAATLVATTSEAVAKAGSASVALSGGSTPKQMGALLASESWRANVPWDRIQFFWGDERWVPLDSDQSNAGEALRGYLEPVGVPSANIHPFATTGVEPDASASAYEATIREIVPGAPVPSFDLLLLGMGDDGHTASLFPGTAAIHEADRLVVAHFVPKLDATRLTFTPPLINAARQVVFLAAGAGKAERLRDVLEGPTDLDTLPSQVVRPVTGSLTWLVDEAAVANLSGERAR